MIESTHRCQDQGQGQNSTTKAKVKDLPIKIKIKAKTRLPRPRSRTCPSRPSMWTQWLQATRSGPKTYIVKPKRLCRRSAKLRLNFSEEYMTNWLVKRLPERGDIVIVAGSDGVKDTSVKAKDCNPWESSRSRTCPRGLRHSNKRVCVWRVCACCGNVLFIYLFKI